METGGCVKASRHPLKSWRFDQSGRHAVAHEGLADEPMTSFFTCGACEVDRVTATLEEDV
jgi:hypothetical protein